MDEWMKNRIYYVDIRGVCYGFSGFESGFGAVIDLGAVIVLSSVSGAAVFGVVVVVVNARGVWGEYRE
jgi:hypothetical protein